MDEYVREFVDETEAAITTLNNLLLDLERSPDDEVIQDIFRTAHTLKGNAGAMGLDRVSDLAHAVEDVLDGIRAGTIDVTPGRMDTLFAAVDCLETMIDELAVEGEIQTDPAETIALLREPLTDASLDVTPPSADERGAILARFSSPSDPAHEAYLVRLAITDSSKLNNGLVVIEALIDAFDLIGTDPSRTAIENEEHGNRIDAVFATAVGEAAISAALEPVDAVEAFSILSVTDELDASDGGSDSSVDDTLTANISSDEANEMSVDDLLDEFTELDDIDALADEIDDVSEFENIGEAGSFDDIMAAPMDEASDEREDSPDTGDQDETASDSVENAGAVFAELKQEVDMVGFDELQDELDELEFDEFDEEEIGMDELLGDDIDADDPAFLGVEEPVSLDEPGHDDASGADDLSFESSTPTWETDEEGTTAAPPSTDTGSPANASDDDPPAADTESVDLSDTISSPEETGGSTETTTDDSTDSATETSAFADELFGGGAADDSAADNGHTTPDDLEPASETDPSSEPSHGPVTDRHEDEHVDVDGPARDSSANTRDVESAADDDESAVKSEPALEDAADFEGSAVDSDAPEPESATEAVDGVNPADDASEAGEGATADDVAAALGSESTPEPDDDAIEATADESAVSETGTADTDTDTADRSSADSEYPSPTGSSTTDGSSDHGDVDAPADGETDSSASEATSVDTSVPNDSAEWAAGEPDADTSVGDSWASSEAAAFDLTTGLDDLKQDDVDDESSDPESAASSADDAVAFDADANVSEVSGATWDTDVDGDETPASPDAGSTLSADGDVDTTEPDRSADLVSDDSDDGVSFEDSTESVSDDADDGITFEDDTDSVTDDFGSDDAFGEGGDFETDDFGVEPLAGDSAFEAEPDFAADTDFESDESERLEDSISFGSESDSVETTGTDFEEDEADPTDEVLSGLPEMAVPDITVPTEAAFETDTDLDAHSQSVRVDREQVDSLLQLVEGLVTSRVRLRSAIDSREPYESLERELNDLEDFTAALQETVMDVRLVPLQTVTDRLPRVVRDLAREQDKQVTFDQSNADVELDRGVLDRIGDPLIHLVRNAVDHGIEDEASREAADKDPEGTIELSAERTQNRVRIEISDDGSGLDADRLRDAAVGADILTRAEADELSDDEAYDLVFHSGLSTADEVTDVSGRGVGMDVVRRTVDELNGTVSIRSDPGDGTTVTMTLPVSVAVDDVLFVESGGEQFGIPVDVVRNIVDGASVTEADGELVYETDDGSLPVIELADAFGAGQSSRSDPDGMLVRIRGDVRSVGLKCDIVHARREVVVKPFEGFMRNIPGVSGATVRGRGEVITILDVSTL